MKTRHFLQEQHLNVPVVEATAKCLGISERSVVRICSEYEKNDGQCLEPCYENCGRKKFVMDPFHQGILRKKIFDTYMRKEYPCVKQLHQEMIRDVDDFPTMSEFAFRDALKCMNFVYKKFQKKPILMENWTVAGKRAEYLSKISNYRRNGWKIYYTDETWCGANHSRKFGWLEQSNCNDHRSSYDHYRSGVQQIDGFRGGFVTPSGSGKRVIILHIGSEDGFVDGGLECFIGNKSSSDYHDEMNAQHYEEWFRKILLLLPPKSVVVIDQAPYHTMLDPEFRNPTAAWKKAEIINWMKKKKIEVPSDVSSFEDITKPRLLLISKPYFNQKHLLLDKVADNVRQGDVQLLWLPVAHCEFNPIELVWAYVKNQVAAKNKTFKIKDVHSLCLEIMNNIPSDLWYNCVQHVKKVENQYSVNESTLADSIDSLVINTGDSEESEESDSIID